MSGVPRRYTGYRVLAERHGVKLAFCRSHVRREFVDLASASLIAAEVLTRNSALYWIEGEIADRSAEARRLAREAWSRPLLIARALPARQAGPHQQEEHARRGGPLCDSR